MFTYDKIGQLTTSQYREKSGSSWSAATNKYKEITTYDKNGNIGTLKRYNASASLLHNYTYTYAHARNGNALTKVSGSDDFLYNVSGHMTKDGQTGVQIEYNILNLPQRVFGTSGEIKYIYAANGEKLASVIGSSLTYYRSVMVYSKAGTAAEQMMYMLQPEGLVAREGSAWVYKYFKTDHQGNTRALLAVRGNAIQNESQNTDYYPTGYTHSSLANLQLNRYLYSGKEYQDATINGSPLGLYDFHARYYNPALGRWFNPDPMNQFINPYTYCLNNPIMYTDPDGKIVWFVPVIIGAAIGAYSGGVMANDGNFNPVKWDYNSGRTWGYMISGAVVGGASGYAGWAVAGSGIPMANTLGIMAGSFTNSVGTWAYTGGQTPISISSGFGSYDFTNGTFGYLGKKGNKWYENLGYGLGALANVSDILIGFRPQKVDLVTEHSDAIGHSAIVEEGSATATGYGNGNPAYADPNGIISVGPNRYTDSNGSWHWMKGTNHWDTHTGAGEVYWRQTLNVNKGTITKYANWLNAREVAGKLTYSVELSSCVTHTSRALNLSGIFNIGIHPYLLNSQMYLWSNGIRPWTFSYFLNK